MSWATEELARVDLGDKRLDRRAATLLERLADNPSATIPDACAGWGEVRAAYRLFDNEAVDFWSIMSPHVQSTQARMAEEPVVLCLQDTTTLDFNGRDIDGLGPLNYEPQRGLLLHPTYVVTPARDPLGLLDSWHWARDPRGEDGQRPATASESERWVEGYERIGEVAASLPDTRCVYVGDRESDMLALMRRAAALDHPADWLVRATHDRTLPDGAKLFATVAEQAPIGTVRFHLRPRRGVKARDIEQSLHVRRVTLGRGADTVEVSCLIAREIAPPPGAKPVEWRLLSNRAIETLEQAATLIDWYRARWEIEMFFDVLKNGCQVETLQLRKLARLEVALAMFLIVAWRINRLMRLGRNCPELDASVAFEPDEITAAYALNNKPAPGPDYRPTVNEVVRLVAMAGGFLARKSDGEPGAKTLWKGLQKVESFAAGLRYGRANPEPG